MDKPYQVFMNLMNFNHVIPRVKTSCNLICIGSVILFFFFSFSLTRVFKALQALDYSPEWVWYPRPTNTRNRKEFFGGGPKILARDFKSKPHGSHETIGTTKPSPWGYLS